MMLVIGEYWGGPLDGEPAMILKPLNCRHVEDAIWLPELGESDETTKTETHVYEQFGLLMRYKGRKA